MRQNNNLVLSKDGKTVIGCRKDYEGTVVIPEGVTEIGYDAFSYCTSLTSIEIPNSVTVIGESAFSGCTSLISIKIPDSVYRIECYAFAHCTKLDAILVDSNNADYCSKDGVLYSKDMSFLIAVPRSKISIEIPEGVTEIGMCAFEECIHLTSIEIPNSVTRIFDHAFQDCTNLTSIKIPDGLTVIEGSTFSGCKSLKSIVIPKGVTEIGYDAFRDCSCLTSIEIPNGVTMIDFGAFWGCTNLVELHLRHKEPIDLSASFIDLDLSKITLFVPEGTDAAYRHHPFYSQFKEVVNEKN